MATPDLLASLITSIQANCAVGVFQSPAAVLIGVGLGELVIVEQLLAVNKTTTGPCYVSAYVTIGGGSPHYIAYQRQIPKATRVDSVINLLEGRSLYMPEDSNLYVGFDSGPSGGTGVDAIAPYAKILN